jgi:hypothetical protein
MSAILVWWSSSIPADLRFSANSLIDSFGGKRPMRWNEEDRGFPADWLLTFLQEWILLCAVIERTIRHTNV